MTIISSADRERQRFEHLALGRPRPEPKLPSRPRGMTKLEWKVEKQRLRAFGDRLAPGIEERVQLRERWAHKQGTPETHENYVQAASRPGAVARLYQSGALDEGQVAAAAQIAATYWMIVRDVCVRTASLETRIDGGRHGRVEEEKLGRVAADLAYNRWRRAVGADGEALLEVIVHDVGLTIVARRLGLGMTRARARLGCALDLWRLACSAARSEAEAILASG